MIAQLTAIGFLGCVFGFIIWAVINIIKGGRLH